MATTSRPELLEPDEQVRIDDVQSITWLADGRIAVTVIFSDPAGIGVVPGAGVITQVTLVITQVTLVMLEVEGGLDRRRAPVATSGVRQRLQVERHHLHINVAVRQPDGFWLYAEAPEPGLDIQLASCPAFGADAEMQDLDSRQEPALHDGLIQQLAPDTPSPDGRVRVQDPHRGAMLLLFPGPPSHPDRTDQASIHERPEKEVPVAGPVIPEARGDDRRLYLSFLFPRRDKRFRVSPQGVEAERAECEDMIGGQRLDTNRRDGRQLIQVRAVQMRFLRVRVNHRISPRLLVSREPHYVDAAQAMMSSTVQCLQVECRDGDLRGQ